MIEISDNGIGISDALHGRLLELFFQSSGQPNGAGLGLYMADKLVKKLGGKLDFHSREGKGSTYTVFLPDIQLG